MANILDHFPNVPLLDSLDHCSNKEKKTRKIDLKLRLNIDFED